MLKPRSPDRRDRDRDPDRRQAVPRLEGLEDRKLLYATLGGSFAFGSRITYSFAPDGTNIGGNPSALFSTLAARGISVSQWEGAIQAAAASWEAAANINLVQVSDDGSAFGAAGDQQGDPRFGDIRIGGSALGGGTLATCFLPPPVNGGSLAGDIVFNDNQSWQVNGDYDLETVAIHEFGHALGLNHSTSSAADMFFCYTGTKQALSPDDTAGIQAVWGTREPDTYGAGTGNASFARASNIASLLNGNGQASIPGLDIVNNLDTHYFLVTAPANTSGTFTVTMQSSGLSSLSPKVVLYNSTQRGLTQTAAANTFGATVTATVTGVTSGQQFYIKTQAANGGITGAGSYGLLVNFGTGTMPAIAPPNTVVAAQPDRGGGSSNEGTSVAVGSLVSTGDALSIEANFQRAVDLVNSGWVAPGTFANPAEVWILDVLADIGHSAPDTAAGHAVRSQAIRAIDMLLDDWGV